jgi:Xaa-Pro aminopeptidase
LRPTVEIICDFEIIDWGSDELTNIQITSEEFKSRSDRLLAYVLDRNLSGVVLFDNYYILYFTGFAFIPTERPIAFVLSANGERALFVPRLEVEHAQAYALIDQVDYYIEYPHDPHPMVQFQRTLTGLGLAKNIGADRMDTRGSWVRVHR